MYKKILLTKIKRDHKIPSIWGYHWQHVARRYFPSLILFTILLLVSCNTSPNNEESVVNEEKTISEESVVETEPTNGCKDQTYPDPATSPYILPFAVGETFETGLTNCSSSYHSAGNPDEYAFDFDMPVGTPFIAARAGTVYDFLDDEPSRGGGVGNFLIIDHHDGTYGLYYHSPKEGFDVEIGDEVKQGDVLGITGRSGLAGYPHLHFIVVKDNPDFPYEGVAVSFRNASPSDIALKSNTSYIADDP